MTRIAMAWCGLFFVVASVSAQTQSVDLLKLIKPEQSTLRGQWERADEGVTVMPESLALCVVPYEVTSKYEVSFEFTRREGDDTVGLVLPLGQTQVLLELGGWAGAAHGFSRVNQAPVKSNDNPTSVRPGTLENHQRYSVMVSVQLDGEDLQLGLKLDEKTLVEWTGKLADVEPNKFVNLRSNKRFALFANGCNVAFHSLRVRHAEDAGKPIELRIPSLFRTTQGQTSDSDLSAFANASMKTVPATGGKIDLTDVVWKDTFNCQLNVAPFLGEDVISLRGSRPGEDGGVALLPGSMMGDGEIEVDIASDIFSGIAFRAADPRNFELLYFRPQNSGTAKHENTVQYSSKGVEGADWRSLRESFPGKYEAGADLEKNAWFHVRLLLKGETLSVFIDDGEEPVLVVEKMLSGRDRGALGLWGWNTRYRNFSFTPLK